MKKTWQEKQKESLQSGYDRAKELAREIWLDENETEDADGRYYFTCGFVAGMKYQRQQALDKLNELDQEMGFE